MKFFSITIILLATLSFFSKGFSQIILTKNGGSSYSIVISKDASLVERFATSELQKYIKDISGAELPIVNNETTKSIFIGEKFARKEGIDLTAKQNGFDGFIIKTMGENLLLAGRNERGTLYAIYAFLEKIGCRWIAPNYKFYGENDSEYIPNKKTIKLASLNIIEKSSFKYRKKYVEEGRTHTLTNMKQMIDWMAKVDMNVFNYPINYSGQNRVFWDSVRQSLTPELKKRGMIIEVGGHGYQNYLPPSKYFNKHPNWFGYINGKRSKDERVVFNTSNKEALEQLTENIIGYLKTHPEIDIFDLWPPDVSIWSNDSESLAQGSPSDRQAIVLNYVSRRISKEFPKLKIEFIAYAEYINPPEKIKITGDNILMDFCPYDRTYALPFWDHRYMENGIYDDALKKWMDDSTFKGGVSYYSYYGKYAWRSLPVIIPHMIQRELQYLNMLGLNGVDSYSEPGNWFTYEIDHYVIAKLSWNCNLNLDSLLQDYYDYRFGKSSNYVNKYFEMIENTVPVSSRIPNTYTTDKSLILNSLNNLTKCKELLKKAINTSGSNKQVLKLLEKLKLSLEYTNLDMQIRLYTINLNSYSMDNTGDTIKKMTMVYKKMKNIFNNNLDKGIFISRNKYYLN